MVFPTMKNVPGPRRSERGFTLIELLITIVIVGILASIAYEGFHLYRERAFDAAVKTDLKNALAAEEGYFADNGSYVAFTVNDGGTIDTPEFTASSQVSVTGTLVGPGIRLEGSHAASSRSWCLSSSNGRVVEGTGC